MSSKQESPGLEIIWQDTEGEWGCGCIVHAPTGNAHRWHLAVWHAVTYSVIEAELTKPLQARQDTPSCPCPELCWEPHCLLVAELEALSIT